MSYCIPFSAIRNSDVASVGGKNASLGELRAALAPLGVGVPDGFAVTADAWRLFLAGNALQDKLTAELARLDSAGLTNLAEVGARCRALIAGGTLPAIVADELLDAYHELAGKVEGSAVAVRSSATAEDLPTASFAGQHDSFLNVSGDPELLAAIKACYVSLYNDRAIKYRLDNGFEHMQVALSVGVQRMVRSDTGSAGVAFTLDPETGFDKVVYLTAAWGLGENVVQGAVNPDEFYVFKPALAANRRSIVKRRLGTKEHKMQYNRQGTGTVNVATTAAERTEYSLPEADVLTLARWCQLIEKHYGRPMDVEWAKDGITGALFIVQARPETVHGGRPLPVMREYQLLEKAAPLCTGKAVGSAIASGRVCIVNSLADASKVQKGDVIVADITNPDWNALLRKAVCIVTNKGGRTSHASIVARELGIHAVVGTGNATEALRDGQSVTVSCAEGDIGAVYAGQLRWKETQVDFRGVPNTRTRRLLILADPERAFGLAMYPSDGVGLMRMEFVIANTIRIHPMALVKFDTLPEGNGRSAIEALTRGYPDKRRYFVDKLAEAMAMVAAAFHPREVIVRMSDFKTNEYAQLIGGAHFEPEEENPMLGFRGASRYYDPRYRDGFGLECEAVRVVRDEMGLTNVKVMIPFCRTLEEAKRVLGAMRSFGLVRHQNGLEVYVMAEIPSNVILAEDFARLFDGFSIGSNDLTQLVLGVDRDSSVVSELFDERNHAVTRMIESVIRKAHDAGAKIGLCGQAPSDHPEFAELLVNAGIDSISFTPDALLRGIENISRAETAGRNSTSKESKP